MLKGILFLSLLTTLLLSFNSAHSYQELDNILKNPVFDIESFIAGLNQKENLQNLESTLVELKKAEPHFFDNYVLMYKSRSLQTSSFMSPRVLLSSPNSTTVITYNGDPKDHGYEKLEVMRFNPQTAKFTFNEISFLNGKLNLSRNNPQKCMNCHQSSSRLTNDPRPNWEPYNIWPGAYSSLAVGGHELFNPKSPKHDPVMTHDAKIENEMYQLFLDDVAPSHPRYNLLKPMQLSRQGVYFPAIGTPKGAPNKFTTVFTDHLLNLNVLRIARLAKETKISKDYNKVFYALTKCGRLYLPNKIFNWHKRTIHQELEEKISTKQFAKAIELIFHPYGISTQDWSMDFGTGGRFAFNHRFGGPQFFKRTLKKALKFTMPEFKEKTCVELKEEILNQDFTKTQPLRAQRELDLLESKNPDSSLISRCVSCHTSYSFGAPHIPFDNESELSRALSKTGYPRGSLKSEIFYRIGTHAQFFERMPADGYLPTTDEINSLKDYLSNL